MMNVFRCPLTVTRRPQAASRFATENGPRNTEHIAVSERGVALVTALLVVTLAAVAAVAMTSRQQIDIRRTQNVLETEQLRFFLYGIEGWAGKMLEQDRRDGEVDHLGEDWAMRLPPVPVDNGQLTGHIEDAQGRFNLNNLILDGKTSAEDLMRLRRLLAALELSPDLADAIVDWIDADIEPLPPYGAEDATYLGNTPPYRAANRLFGDVSELRLVAGIDAAGYRLLAPHLAALPARTAINLNTASAAVIMALADGIGRSEAEDFVATRQDQHYSSVDAALQQPVFANRTVARDGLGVSSNHFVVMSAISLGRLEQRYASLLRREDNGAATLIVRTQLYL